MTRRSYLRHLPPTAVPLKSSDLTAGLLPENEAISHFRADLAAYLGLNLQACRLASSGRSALYCLLHGLKGAHPRRRQVVMPAYTCPAVARVVIDLGLHPVYVDISSKSMAYIEEHLSAALGRQTLAVILVHPFGIPLPVEETLALAHEAGAVLIEDAAQSLGAQWLGKPVGRKGDFALFSLGPGKPLSTGGGGIVIANKVEGLEPVSRGFAGLSKRGSLASIQAWARQSAFQLAFHPLGWWAATRVGLHRVGNHEASWGYKLTRLTPAQAAVGRRLLPRLMTINAARRQKGQRLLAALQKSGSLQPVDIAPGAEPFYLRFPIIAQNEKQREDLYETMWKKGIGAGRLYEKTLPEIFDPHNKTPYPGAQAVARRLLTLPTHHYVTDADLQLMESTLAGM